jgi:hydrogenase-4 component F
VSGILKLLPISGTLWVGGFFAITGSPPFGPFVSEFVILKSALEQGRIAVATVYLVLLCAIFSGMALIVLRMSQGIPRPVVQLPGKVIDSLSPMSESSYSILPPAMLGAAVLMLGIYIPPALRTVLEQAARTIAG